MPIGKARDLLRTRKPKDDERDPGSLEAYEEGWYALLARQASGDDRAAPPTCRDAVEAPKEEPPAEAPRLAVVKPLVAVPEDPAKPVGDGAPPTDPTPPKASERPRRAEPSTMRIGVRRQEEPGSVYLAYLTSSPHRYYFRGEWWPASSSSISPMHLWRANHLGAHWEIADVERFMATAAALADELISRRPARRRPVIPIVATGSRGSCPPGGSTSSGSAGSPRRCMPCCPSSWWTSTRR